MKLNHECVRNILLTVEQLEPDESITIDNYINYASLAPYDEDEIVYAVERLIEAKFIPDDILEYYNGKAISFDLTALTWDGHAFLENIKNDSVWQKAKTVVAEKVSSTSLSIVADTASEIVKKMLGF